MFFYSAAHYPFSACPCDVNVNSMVVLLRNPILASESFFRFVVGKSHTKTEFESSQQFKDLKEKYDQQWEKANLETWEKQFSHYLSLPVPILFLKFDEFIMDPQETLFKLFRFLLRRESLEGTIVNEKIKRYQKKVIYTPGGSKPVNTQVKLSELQVQNENVIGLLTKFGLMEGSNSDWVNQHNEAVIKEVSAPGYVQKSYHVKQPENL
eukprot:CAMPEP_0170566492 /NCGR_PEP_ID=MMETSP0211-20121228/79874_1 /TAXON_ID=311385 /ORGANISM="Pseudokeronopsis sp., Strain OXSARD2" /LENGTH=208 /DNA_ID=CAMNT_0010887683 /DNA_START=656 /DNA_END=1282 /DNA_ORIENTATION=+